jgi:7-carboxy-7-deazaguanine synthase (Cx14CxxC type)
VTYSVKEIFYTLQGEGAQTGRPAVFCRFAGCNLWSGREQDRQKAVCRFCDTDFRGTDGESGGKYRSAEELSERIAAAWPRGADAAARPFLVCTGGEPLLQLDDALIRELHARGFEVAVETNGTRPAPAGLDWVCVSPKTAAELAIRAGDELKLVYPQDQAPPERFAHLSFAHFFLQPMDGPQREAHTRASVAYCKAHPKWRLSLQTHKLLDIP